MSSTVSESELGFACFFDFDCRAFLGGEGVSLPSDTSSTTVTLDFHLRFGGDGVVSREESSSSELEACVWPLVRDFTATLDLVVGRRGWLCLRHGTRRQSDERENEQVTGY